MNAKTQRRILLSLIKADLINCKLVFGLSELGLDAGAYFTDLNEIIFDLAGISESARLEQLHEEYFQICAKSKEIDIQNGPEGFNQLAAEVYEWLERRTSKS